MVSTKAGALEVTPQEVRMLTPSEVRLKDGRLIQGTLVGQTIKARTPLGELAIKVDELASFRADPEPGANPEPQSTASRGTSGPSATGPMIVSPPTPVRGPSGSTSTTPMGALPPADMAATGPPATSQPAPRPAATGGPAPGVVAALPEPEPIGGGGPTQVVDGAKAIGYGVERTAKGIGRTVVEGADAAHDGIKEFGLRVW